MKKANDKASITARTAGLKVKTGFKAGLASTNHNRALARI
jgi:hypothetical protein